MTSKSLVLLTDYRGSFYSRTANQRTLCTMDVAKICEYFGKFGYSVEVAEFKDIRVSEHWRGRPVLYASSEDSGSLYKSYIEDVALALELSGAILLPKYCFLRAHHNKSFMEELRYVLFPKEAEGLNTRIFGTFEELAASNLIGTWPKVIKSAFGAGSKMVAKAANEKELLTIARRFSRSLSAADILREMYARIFWRGYVKRSHYRKKFVVQNYISGMAGDFKVLKYGARYYLLSRRNRTGDFRASGSGKFSVEIPEEINKIALLEFAKKSADVIGTPLCSMDIGFNGEGFHLIEFQCLNFGPLTAEISVGYYSKIDGEWRNVVESCDLEYVLVEAISSHLDGLHDRSCS